jgi:Mycothiol maleylpyruvate isomerase N-terminal domain
MQQWITAQTNLAHAHTTFQHVAAALPSDCRDQTGVCGQWTPKQVAAHLAGWEREAARALQALLAGAPEDLVSDIDVFNHASVDARTHLSWEGTCWELHTAHESLQRAIDAIIQAYAPALGYLSWMEGRIVDYEVHTAQLRAWLQEESSHVAPQ